MMTFSIGINLARAGRGETVVPQARNQLPAGGTCFGKSKTRGSPPLRSFVAAVGDRGSEVPPFQSRFGTVTFRHAGIGGGGVFQAAMECRHRKSCDENRAASSQASFSLHRHARTTQGACRRALVVFRSARQADVF